MIFKLGFAYHMPRNTFPRESRIAMVVAVLLALASFLDYFVNSTFLHPTRYYVENHNFASSYVSFYVPLVGLLIFLWSLVIFFRQWRTHRGKNPLEARTAKWFFMVTLLELVISFFYVAQRFDTGIGIDLYELITNTGVSLIFFFYVLLYLNVASEPSSFIVKLVGISLVTVMTLTSALGLQSLIKEEKRYDEARRGDIQTAQALLAANLPLKADAKIAYSVPADYKGPFPRKGADDKALTDRSDQGLLYFNLHRDSKRPHAGSADEGSSFGSDVHEGRIYRLIDGDYYIAYRNRFQDRLYETGFLYDDYRRRMHAAARYNFLVVIISTLLMLLVFPFFFRATITGPLQKLLTLLKEAEPAGTNIESGENEIVHLSRSFTNMLNLLKTAKKRFYDYSEHLEEVERLVESYSTMEVLRKPAGDRTLVCASSAMRGIFRKAERFADLKQPALITGETGTGKELIARLIHHDGARGDKPFVPVNCAAVPDALWEDEIFGHVKGAFTDARNARPGSVREAGEGTLFFDEIGEMPAAMQAKMLRLLQERQFQAVGSDELRPALCRFLFATNRDLEAMVRDGHFREDLYYRINVFHVHIPPLRERAADIPVLVDLITGTIAADTGRDKAVIEEKAMAALTAYPWPGNIRELENVLTRAIAGESLETLRLADLPRAVGMSGPRNPEGEENMDPGDGETPLVGTYDEIMRAYSGKLISYALRKSGGNKTRAAELLGIKRNRLRYQIKELDLE